MKIRNSLSGKIIIWIAVSILLTASSIVGYSVFTLRCNALKAAQEQILVLVNEEGFKIKQLINSAIFAIRTMAQVLGKVHDPNSPIDIPRYEASGLIRTILEENPTFRATFTCWEVNGYDFLDEGYVNEAGHDATGRFAPLWRWGENEQPILSPLLTSDEHSRQGAPGSWYTSPRETLSFFVRDSFFDKSSGAMLTTVTVPVIAQETFYGVVGVDLSLQSVQEQVDEMHYYEGTAEAAVITRSGTIVASSGQAERAGRHITDVYEEHRHILASIQSGNQYIGVQQGRLFVVSPLQFDESSCDWAIVLTVPVASLTKNITILMWKQIAIFVSIMAVMTVLSMLGARKILTRPLAGLLQGIRRVSQGNLDYNVEIASSDEIGIIAESFNSMRRKLKKLINTLKSYQQELEKKVARRTEALELSNRKIEKTRNKLQKALDEISALIQIIVEKGGELDAFFEHPELGECWLEMKCGQEECPCYGKEPQRCWQVENTQCYNELQKDFEEKYAMCRQCLVYKNATSDPIYQIGEYFNNMIFILNKNKEKLDHANRQLYHAQKMESVGQLAAGIAHEINTPIQYVGSNIDFLDEAFADVNGLIGQVQMLMEVARKKGILPEETKRLKNSFEELDWQFLAEEIPQAINQSRDGVHRVSTIVLAMKEFSHPGSKEKSDNDLNKIIANTVTIASNEWKYVAEMEMDLDPQLPLVPCLSEEIGQVVLNMVVNAAHAIADKVGKQEGEKGHITIKTRHDENWLGMTIRDTGGGIPADILSRIFDPFFTTKEVGSGSGQGLAIAHDVVTKHGGVIKVKSKEGEGTTFLVKLPLQKERDEHEVKG